MDISNGLIRRATSIASVLVVLVTTALPFKLALAQGNAEKWSDYRDVHHRNDCRLAHQVLTHGQPEVKREWALSIVSGCGPLGGEAIAHLLREHRSDIERRPELERVVTQATKFRDRAIYEAALEIAVDPSAGEVGRVQALRALYNQLRPGNFAPYESFVTDSLMPFGISTYHVYTATPLPDDAYETIIEEMEALTSSVTTPSPVRRASLIVWSAARTVMDRSHLEMRKR
jgi:hypothetical protein